MLRKTRITLVVPWDDEDHDHPSAWGWDWLIGLADAPVVVVDFEDQDPPEEVDDN